uniref:Uncharacterized protein n=1 Tax=Rhizophora mucronata TaxID=61149 RepID=A0A2P2QBA6_RHIMU
MHNQPYHKMYWITQMFKLQMQFSLHL